MVNRVVWGPVMLCLLLFVGIMFTVRLRFFQISKIKLWMNHTMGSFFHRPPKKEKQSKAISPFQAMTTALAGHWDREYCRSGYRHYLRRAWRYFLDVGSLVFWHDDSIRGEYSGDSLSV